MHDLKNFHADDLGAFQFVSPGDAFVAFVCIIVVGMIFSPWLK